MEFPELDRLFNETHKRLSEGKPSADPYGEGPLASDHFLLQKSWEFFRRRLHTLEEQWADMARAKEAQMQALTKQLGQAADRLKELEGKREDRDHLAEAYLRDRNRELLGFLEDEKRLRAAWDEERGRLQEQVDALEAALRASELARARDEAEAKEHEEDLRNRLRLAEGGARDIVERARAAEKELLEEIARRDERIVSFENQVTVLRAEVERRAQAIGDLSAKEADLARREAESEKRIESADRRLEEARVELEQRRSRIVELEKEKAEIRASWQREQAEWRELWERSRELWQRQGKTD